jgi:hypothetical protein
MAAVQNLGELASKFHVMIEPEMSVGKRMSISK